MADVWVKRRSWHLLRSAGTGTSTRCGLWVEDGTRLATIPLGERTCERCLRYDAHDREVASR